METIRELRPFAMEMLSERPSRGMLRVYIVGSVLALLGLVVGLIQMVFLPFCQEEHNIVPEANGRKRREDVISDEFKARLFQCENVQRNAANRLHAS